MEKQFSKTPIVAVALSGIYLLCASNAWAKVCFVTDTEDCSGYKFNIDNKASCEKEGYKLTSCPELMKPANYCPYDHSFFEKCVCMDGLVTCSPPYQGVGKSCGGKFKSCCNTCPGYDYSSIPDGYESIGSCNSCNGVKYKVQKKHEHSYICPSGYQAAQCGSGYDTVATTPKTCSCGESMGTCYKCQIHVHDTMSCPSYGSQEMISS